MNGGGMAPGGGGMAPQGGAGPSHSGGGYYNSIPPGYPPQYMNKHMWRQQQGGMMYNSQQDPHMKHVPSEGMPSQPDESMGQFAAGRRPGYPQGEPGGAPGGVGYGGKFPQQQVPPEFRGEEMGAQQDPMAQRNQLYQMQQQHMQQQSYRQQQQQQQQQQQRQAQQGKGAPGPGGHPTSASAIMSGSSPAPTEDRMGALPNGDAEEDPAAMHLQRELQLRRQRMLQQQMQRQQQQWMQEGGALGGQPVPEEGQMPCQAHAQPGQQSAATTQQQQQLMMQRRQQHMMMQQRQMQQQQQQQGRAQGMPPDPSMDSRVQQQQQPPQQQQQPPQQQSPHYPQMSPSLHSEGSSPSQAAQAPSQARRMSLPGAGMPEDSLDGSYSSSRGGVPATGQPREPMTWEQMQQRQQMIFMYQRRQQQQQQQQQQYMMQQQQQYDAQTMPYPERPPSVPKSTEDSPAPERATPGHPQRPGMEEMGQPQQRPRPSHLAVQLAMQKQADEERMAGSYRPQGVPAAADQRMPMPSQYPKQPGADPSQGGVAPSRQMPPQGYPRGPDGQPMDQQQYAMYMMQRKRQMFLQQQQQQQMQAAQMQGRPPAEAQQMPPHAAPQHAKMAQPSGRPTSQHQQQMLQMQHHQMQQQQLQQLQQQQMLQSRPQPLAQGAGAKQGKKKSAKEEEEEEEQELLDEDDDEWQPGRSAKKKQKGVGGKAEPKGGTKGTAKGAKARGGKGKAPAGSEGQAQEQQALHPGQEHGHMPHPRHLGQQMPGYGGGGAFPRGYHGGHEGMQGHPGGYPGGMSQQMQMQQLQMQHYQMQQQQEQQQSRQQEQPPPFLPMEAPPPSASSEMDQSRDMLSVFPEQDLGLGRPDMDIWEGMGLEGSLFNQEGLDNEGDGMGGIILTKTYEEADEYRASPKQTASVGEEDGDREGTEEATFVGFGGGEIEWKAEMQGKKDEIFRQVFMAVYLYDPRRDLSVRIDDTGLFFVQGSQETTPQALWALMEAGSWVSWMRWESSDGRKVLKRMEVGGDQLWQESNGPTTIAEFVENEWEVALCSTEKSSDTILRARSGACTKATQPGMGDHSVSLEDLESLDNKVLSKGSWDWTGPTLQWRPTVKRGISLTMLDKGASTKAGTKAGKGGKAAKEPPKWKRKGQEKEEEEHETASRPPLPKQRKGSVVRGLGKDAGKGLVAHVQSPCTPMTPMSEDCDERPPETKGTKGAKKKGPASRAEAIANAAPGLLALQKGGGKGKKEEGGKAEKGKREEGGKAEKGKREEGGKADKGKREEGGKVDKCKKDDAGKVDKGKKDDAKGKGRKRQHSETFDTSFVPSRSTSPHHTKGGWRRVANSPSSDYGVTLERVAPLEECICGRECVEGDRGVLLCGKCKHLFHATCVNISPGLAGLPYTCQACKAAHPRRRESKDAGKHTEAKDGKDDAVTAREARKTAKKLMQIESAELDKKLSGQGLCLVEIPSDGHCLFSAIGDQMRRSSGKGLHVAGLTHKALRKMAAEYILNHEEEFKEFLSLNGESFESYCRKVERTNAWGGQHELVALCRALKRNIVVFRHDMSKQQFPDPATDKPYGGAPLMLSYHMHTDGGEHYNSVVKINEKNGRRRRGAPPLEDTVETAGEKVLESKESDDNEDQAQQASPKGDMADGCAKGEVPDGFDDTDRVPVFDSLAGRVLNGNCAPMAKNLSKYLQEHPHMRVYKEDEEDKEEDKEGDEKDEEEDKEEEEEEEDGADADDAGGGGEDGEEGSDGDAAMRDDGEDAEGGGDVQDPPAKEDEDVDPMKEDVDPMKEDVDSKKGDFVVKSGEAASNDDFDMKEAETLGSVEEASAEPEGSVEGTGNVGASEGAEAETAKEEEKEVADVAEILGDEGPVVPLSDCLLRGTSFEGEASAVPSAESEAEGEPTAKGAGEKEDEQSKEGAKNADEGEGEGRTSSVQEVEESSKSAEEGNGEGEKGAEGEAAEQEGGGATADATEGEDDAKAAPAAVPAPVPETPSGEGKTDGGLVEADAEGAGEGQAAGAAEEDAPAGDEGGGGGGQGAGGKGGGAEGSSPVEGGSGGAPGGEETSDDSNRDRVDNGRPAEDN